MAYPGFTNVFLIPEGHLYSEYQQFCPNDGYELTKQDPSDPMKIWYRETCPIDDIKTATLATVQNITYPVYTVLSPVISDHQEAVTTSIGLTHTVVSTWLLHNSTFERTAREWFLDHGNLREMIYVEMKRQGLIYEMISINPPE